MYGKYPPQNKRQETLNAYSQGYEDGTDNFYNAIIPIIRSHINGVPDMDNGWIPVSEKLPEEDGFYLATLDGEICGQEEAFTGLAEFEHGKWIDDEEGYKCVLAWQPLPEPYIKNPK